MSMTELLKRRLELIRCLQHTPADQLDASRVINALTTWFQAYKTWEAGDRFVTACQERRMVIRQSLQAGQVPDGCVNGLSMRGRNEPVGEKGTMYNAYISNVGLDGIKNRMNPDMFKRAAKPYDTGTYIEWRGKYMAGLHDLSASLFNPDKRTISEQCRWKDDGKGGGKFADWHLVFIPLAPSGEVRLFQLMKGIAARKQKTGGLFAQDLARISKRMTRITYAQESDMGAGFVFIGHKGEGADRLPRFRYGAGDVQSSLDAQGTLEVKHVPNISSKRQDKALDYKQLLELQVDAKSTSNEVILKARERAGDRFPIFAQWNPSKNGFVCASDEKSSSYIGGRVIPDVWSSVIER